MSDTDPSILINLEDIEEFKGGDESYEEMKKQYQGTIFEEIPDVLREGDLFRWFDVVEENKQILFSGSTVIGTEEIDLMSVLNQEELFKLLAKDDTAEWSDGIEFHSIYLLTLGDIINERFNSNEEFIDYYMNTIAEEESREEVEEIFSDAKQEGEDISDEDRAVLSDGMTRETTPSIAKGLTLLGISSGMSMLPFESWDNEPEIGQYLVFGNSEQGRVLVKVVDKKHTPLMLSELVGDDIEEDIKIDERVDIVVETVNYDESVLEEYPNYFLLPDDSEEATRISMNREEEFVRYDEKPTHLFEERS